MSLPQVISEPGDFPQWRTRPAPQGDGLRQILRPVLARWKMIAGVVATVTVLTALGLSQVTPRYTATATVLLETQRQTVVNVEAVLQGLTADPVTVENQLQILQSREMARTVLEALGLWGDAEFQVPQGKGLMSMINPANWFGSDDEGVVDAREYAISKFLSRLTVTVRGRSSAIAVAFTSADPDKAARIANAVADAYVNGQVKAKVSAGEQATAWLSVQVEELGGQVRQAEQKVAAYQSENNLTDVEGGTIIDKQLMELNAQLAIARAARAQAESRYRQTEGGGAVSAVTASVLMSDLRSQEALVMRKVAELSSRYQDQHPNVRDARAELADLRAKIGAEEARIIGAIKTDFGAAEATEAQIEAQIAKLEVAANVQRGSMVQMRQLQREASTVRTLYESMLTRLKETERTNSMQVPDARVLSLAAAPSNPSSPNAVLIFGAIIPVSLALAILAAVVMQRLQSAYETSREVEDELDVQVIGTMPEVKRVRGDVAAFALEQPGSAFAESLRSVETGLTLSNLEAPPRAVLVTSAVPGEGKTVLAVGLARAMARKGQRVVLVDFDLRHAHVLKSTGAAAPARDLFDALSGRSDISACLTADPKSDVDILGIAVAPPNAPDILGAAAVRALIGSLRERYDMVVIDAAPVLPVNDTKLLVRHADAVLLAVRAGRAPREAVADARDQIRDASGHVAGVVLTRADKRAGGMTYYGGGRAYAGFEAA